MCVFSVEGGTVRVIGEHNEKDQVYRVTIKKKNSFQYFLVRTSKGKLFDLALTGHQKSLKFTWDTLYEEGKIQILIPTYITAAIMKNLQRIK